MRHSGRRESAASSARVRHLAAPPDHEPHPVPHHGAIAAGFKGEPHRAGTAGRNDDTLADADRIAGKPNRFVFRQYDKPLFLRDPLRDRGQAIGIEGGRKVQQLSAAERTKAGIQVVEPAVDEFERNDLTLKDFAQLETTGCPTLAISAEPYVRKSKRSPAPSK